MSHTASPFFFQDNYPPELTEHLRGLCTHFPELYLAGGAVRDILLGVVPNDLDFTLPKQAVEAARLFSRISGGTFVLLDQQEDIARVVWHGCTFDFTSYREDAVSLAEDLRLRDFTINAMALTVHLEGSRIVLRNLCDPCGGVSDLRKGCVRSTSPDVFKKDPLRILRAFRTLANSARTLDSATASLATEQRALLRTVSPERIAAELDCIMASTKAGDLFCQLAEAKILHLLFPELVAGRHMKQPGSHHLDVFDHNLAALAALEALHSEAGRRMYADTNFTDYLADTSKRFSLKWAAFFHDIGKPQTLEMRQGRTTFYNHDGRGSELVSDIADRLKWSKRRKITTMLLVKHHMWPFHLVNARQKTGLRPRSSLKMYKAVGDDLPGLFLLALADSMAAQGPDKPEGMEKSIFSLYHHIQEVVRTTFAPILAQPVLTGYDLIDHFQLTPGPLFKTILDGLEEAQVVSGRMTQSEALAWVDSFLHTDSKKTEHP